MTPLAAACEKYDVPTICKLLEQGADPNVFTDKGKSCLDAVYRNIDIIRMLIAHGADVNIRNRDITNGSTPIHRYFTSSFSEKEVDIVNLLLDSGADANLRNEWENTIYDNAVRFCRDEKLFDRIYKLTDNTDAQDSMVTAYDYNNSIVVNYFLQRGVSVNAKDKSGNCIIFTAAQMANKTPLKKLLEHKELDINAKARDGMTPLMAACAAGTVHNIDVLLDHGANINDIDSNGKNALFYAIKTKAWSKKYEIVASLINHGVDINIQDQKGHTPLYDAVDANAFTVCQLLLKHGADPFKMTKRGYPPIRAAINNGAPKLVKLLLEAGANPCEVLKNGSRPIDVCPEFAKEKISMLINEFMTKSTMMSADSADIDKSGYEWEY